jgi:hypothetical protein
MLDTGEEIITPKLGQDPFQPSKKKKKQKTKNEK